MKLLLSMALSAAIMSSQTLSAKPWKSGEILTQDTYRYGAFEARFKATRGDAAVSSFYLLKENSWVQGQEWQELDFEILGKNGAYAYQTQIMTPGDPRTQHIGEHQHSQPLSDDFHTYRMEWTPNELKFYFDGQLIRTETDRSEYSKFLDASRVEDMRLRMGMWAGFSDWSGTLNTQALPTPFIVDWVRVYQLNDKDGSFSLLWEDQFDSFDTQRWTKADWTFEYAINDFTPGNVYTQDGYLTMFFSAE